MSKTSSPSPFLPGVGFSSSSQNNATSSGTVIREKGKNLFESGSSSSKLFPDEYNEMSKYSITPTTFETRTLQPKCKLISDDFTWYIDEFSHKCPIKDSQGNPSTAESMVLRYGINASKLKLQNTKLKAKGGAVDKVPSTIKQKDLFSSLTKNTDIQTQAEKVTHEDLEEFLITKAIDHLLGTSDKAVLVDIFARHDPSHLKLQDDGSLEVHTVVLYKNPSPLSNNNNPTTTKHEILVIDPSNFSYSSHIANLNTKLHSKLANSSLFGEIISLHRKLHIYTANKDNVGFDPLKYRDCIDVSVKLAFGLSAENAYVPITTNKQNVKIMIIEKVDAIKFISNQPDIDDGFFFESAVSPLRIKQNSDVRVVKAFYKLEHLVDNATKLIRQNVPSKIKDASKQIINIITTNPDNNSKVLEALKIFCAQHTKACVKEHTDTVLQEMHTFELDQTLGLIGLDHI